ncbi:MAG: hypothetical protein AB2A00_30800 [Myxococcota bacterium]
MSLTMPEFRARLSTLLQDGRINHQEAQDLVATGLTAEQKTALATELKLDQIEPAERDAVLQTLGLQASQLGNVANDGVVGKVKEKLVELARKEIYKPQEFAVADLRIGEHVGAAVRVQTRLLSAQDPVVTNDANRAAATARLEQGGKDVTWAYTGGGLYPSAGFSVSVPNYPFNVTAGFSANASLGYSLLAPYPHKAEAALAAIKNNSVDLPFTSERARSLTEGTELLVRGKGTVASHAGVGAGATLARVGSILTAGASVGVSVAASKELEVSLRVKRLDGDRVFVSLNQVNSGSASGSVNATVGVDANTGNALPEMGGGVFRRGAELVTDQVDKQVEKWLRVDLRAAHSRSSQETNLQNYVLDLSDPKAAEAYEALLKLDTRSADKLAQDGSAAVRFAKLEEGVRTQASSLSANFGPITLLNVVSTSSQTHGTLTSSKGDITYDRSRLDEGYSGIISNIFLGARATTRELVMTTEPGNPPQSYYHVRSTITGDRVSTKDDVKDFLRLADALGALDDGTRALLGNDKFLKAFGTTNRTVDIYFTDDGLKKLAGTSADAVHQSYARAYEELEGGKATWVNADPAKRQEIEALFKRTEEHLRFGTDQQEMQQLENEYYWATRQPGWRLRQEVEAWREAQNVVKLVDTLRAAHTPEERARAFAKADKELGLDFSRALHSLASLAGANNVLINELAIRDKNSSRDVVFMREGAIQDPSTQVNAILANPA